jgi:hypothetical protein
MILKIPLVVSDHVTFATQKKTNTPKRITILLVNPVSEAAGCRLRWLNIRDCSDKSNQIHVTTVSLPRLPSKPSNILPLLSRKWYKYTLKKLAWKLGSLLASFKIADADVIVFGKPYTHGHIKAMQIARQFNKKIISDFCDFHSSSHSSFYLASCLSDVITAPTKLLAERIITETGKHVTLIPDHIDFQTLALSKNLSSTSLPPSPRYTILWFGLGFANGKPTESLQSFCQLVAASSEILIDQDIHIEVISENANLTQSYLTESMGSPLQICFRSIQWSPEAMARALLSPGFAIIPYPKPVRVCEKSPNRIELALYQGKVVISNGKHLPSLDDELVPHVRDLPLQSLSLTDLEFVPYDQELQVKHVRRYLDAKQYVIKDLWYNLIESMKK